MKKYLFALIATIVSCPFAANADVAGNPDIAGVEQSPKAFKSGREVVEAFYELISSTGDDSTLADRAALVIAPKWNAEPDMLTGDGLSGFVSTFSQYHYAIPDMQWAPQEILRSGSNRYIARCVGTGTPVFDFLHLGDSFKPGSSFKIMTIDIHTVKNGKIVQTYHTEDWKTAMQQLQGMTQ